MDYESDSSDFHFPQDTGLAKLSSPLSFKVPESRDWALDEFMQTLSEKPHMETDNLISFKQYLPVSQEEEEEEEEDYYTTGPPKLTLATYEEKDFLQQISQHFIDLKRKELHDILKGGFNLVQNDIQTNINHHHQKTASPFATSAHPDISWFDEAFDYGHHQRNSSMGIHNLENIDFKRSPNRYSPFDQSQVYHSNMLNTSSIILSEEEEEEEELPSSVVIPIKEIPTTTTSQYNKEEEKIITTQIEKPVLLVQPIEYHKPLPALPSSTTLQPEVMNNNKKKGLKYKLQSKFSKTFLKQKESKETLATTSTTTSKGTTPLFLQKSKKFIKKIFINNKQQA